MEERSRKFEDRQKQTQKVKGKLNMLERRDRERHIIIREEYGKQSEGNIERKTESGDKRS